MRQRPPDGEFGQQRCPQWQEGAQRGDLVLELAISGDSTACFQQVPGRVGANLDRPGLEENLLALNMFRNHRRLLLCRID